MRTFYLNPTVYNKMYSVMQYINALALRVSLETGLRIDDVLSLRRQQLQKRTLFGIAKKTKKSFRKVISQDLAKRLTEIQGQYYIFEGRLSPKKHRTRQAVWKDVKKAAQILEINGNIAPHSARKTYSVELFRDGGLANVKRELQHNDIQTTMLYAFADYLDDVQINRTNVLHNEEEAAGERKQTKETPPSAQVLDGDFWLTFADLVAQKTAERLVEILRASAI
jgi:integrase